VTVGALWSVLLWSAIGCSTAGCPTVHRYGPDEGEPSSRSVRVTPRETPRQRDVRVQASPLADQLGDGSLRSELLAGARRVVGWRFGREDVAEADAFRLHLQAVALWEGDMVPVADPMPGDVWRGNGQAFGVVETASVGGRWGIIAVGADGAVARREVAGGRFERAVGAARSMGSGHGVGGGT
jgi:hypothetical protein